ncbi:hypothetical protein BASA50_003913 [Batrachochytrium salamandrivorans]|uniref:SnoaL-like domain-containing protein n=1 Tax=Batrachochytrium salamandrivorans TaxID=1357716 RepID=A0ABQ8FHE4_9FUNG|nr:hypothetical protein BASA60_008633 [Batrachochytrium salamandrivorans]KAH6574585.1 hypothetical protein BASA62_002384 [Batrachochytrium salamandrivorans]KAH6598299.1 hypothetical protein BASA50_003913 [Batrachochytrium salamandrivorans]KAH6602970.1 hypothetical protein BASA61_000596 [Batrachochytrium salamandrivorans]KAH9265919.1 hypothetical protein BASA84_001379 [Batrachochytrium salamandrivorans]
MLSVLEAHKTTLSQSSSSVMQQVGLHFADNASILCVPTASGAQGKRAIEEWVKNAGRQAHIIDNEEILSRIVSAQSVVEESILRLTHTDPIDWLLPGVRPTKKQIVVPMVTILTFDENGKIASKRVYWDQASVLRQVGVLPRSLYCKANSSEVQLPILDGSIVNQLQDSLFEHNVLLRADVSAGLSSAQRDAMENKPTTPTKGRVAAQGIVPQGDEVHIRTSTLRPKTDVLNIEPEVSLYDGSSAAPTRRESTISSVFHDNATAAIRPSTRVIQPSGGHSSNIFGQDEPIRSAHASRAAESISRQMSQTSLNQVEEESVSNQQHLAGRRAFSGKTNESQFSFGGNNSDAIVDQQHKVNGHGMGRRGYGDMNKSQFSFGTEHGDAPDSPNHHHNSLHTGRKINSASNQSQFAFGSETPETMRTSATNSGRSSVASIPRSSHVFDDEPLPNKTYVRSGRRDPNAMSTENSVRSSSRVLKAPGGGSSLTFY